MLHRSFVVAVVGGGGGDGLTHEYGMQLITLQQMKAIVYGNGHYSLMTILMRHEMKGWPGADDTNTAMRNKVARRSRGRRRRSRTSRRLGVMRQNHGCILIPVMLVILLFIPTIRAGILLLLRFLRIG